MENSSIIYDLGQSRLYDLSIKDYIERCIKIIKNEKIKKIITNQISHILNYIQSKLPSVNFNSNKQYSLQEITQIQEYFRAIHKKLQSFQLGYFKKFGENLQYLKDFDEIQKNLKHIQRKIYFKDGESQLNIKKMTISYNSDILKQIDLHISKLSQINEQFTDEYALICWQSQYPNEKKEILNREEFFQMCKTYIYKIEGIKLNENQLTKIGMYVDLSHLNEIKINNCCVFFSLHWTDVYHRQIILDNKQLNFKSETYQQEQLVIKLIKAPESIFKTAELQLLKDQGKDINQYGIIDDENGLGNGKTRIGKNSGNIKEADIVIKHDNFSKKQMIIEFNPLTGFNLIDLSNSNFTFISLQNDEKRAVFKNNVINLFGDYKVIIEQVTQNDQMLDQLEKQQNNLMQPEEDLKKLLGGNINQRKLKIIKKHVEQQTHRQQLRKQIKREQQEIVIRIENEFEEDAQKIRNRKIIGKEGKSVFIGKAEINDDKMEEQCLEFYVDIKENQWKVRCHQKSNLVMLYLKDVDQIKAKVPSTAFNLENGDRFGVDTDDEAPILFEVKISGSGPKFECQSCFDEFSYEDDAAFLNLFNCDHFICADCQFLSAGAAIEMNMIQFPKQFTDFEYKCLDMQCEEKVKQDVLKQRCPNIYENFHNAYLKNYQISCPNENIRCTNIILNVEQEGKLQCNKCKLEICGNCNMAYHGEQFCKEAILNNVRKFKNVQDKFRFCPKCYHIYLKDNACDHVSCQKCPDKVEFCFQCSAFREPTLIHGNHYHRSDCKYYSKYDEPEYSPEKCSFCKNEGKACAKPLSYKDFLKQVQEQIGAGDQTMKVLAKK